MNLPKISVLIPCFNHEKYVLNCLQSVSTAYSGELEVIICDDKSSDNSVEKVENYIRSNNNSNITYLFLKHTVNLGITKTLNECVRHATAEHIYIIASDDFLLEEGLTKAMKVLSDSNADAVINDCNVVDSDNQLICNSAFFEYRRSSLKRLHDRLAEELVFNWVVPGPALLQKKSCCIDIGLYDEELKAEDREYYLRLLAYKKVVFNENPIASYRVHLNNFSRSKEYLEKTKLEFFSVNYFSSGIYTGLTKLYLKSYWLDINNVPGFVTSNLRKIIKMIYILRD